MVDKVEVDRERREGKRVRVGYMKLRRSYGDGIK